LVHHQNIRGLRHKLDELLISLSPNLPHVICITEHHLTNAELDGVFAPQYALGGNFCRKLYRCGGVCIFAQDNIAFSKINCDKLNKEKDLEMCAVKVHLVTKNMVIISIYRSPVGDFKFFLSNLEILLNSIYSNTIDIIICGDLNINYIQENHKKITVGFLTCFLQFT
jgi:exonuclease III